MNTKLTFSILITLVLFACVPDESVLISEEKPSLPENLHKYGEVVMPAHFDFMAVDGSNGDVTAGVGNALIDRTFGDDQYDAKATLGRVLFYDKKLSLNNTVSCASCHDQKAGFADPVDFSEGFKGQKTTRNSMALANPVYNNSFFWDSRTHDLESLILQPVADHIEMGMEELDKLNTKLANTTYYGDLFDEAYGSQNITSFKISEAISCFLNSMVSRDSKFDEGVVANFQNFTAQEMRGKEIFYSAEAKCGTCHAGANFSAPDGNFNFEMRFSQEDLMNNPSLFNVSAHEYGETLGTANIGLDEVYADNGRRNGEFKIPSLRNIAVTGPYMHDGRFQTLDEVIDHYDQKIQPHNHLDDKFKSTASAIQNLGLSSSDKQALKAFLNTLTDNSLLTDEKFSNPF